MTKDNWIKAFDEFAAGNEIGPGLETMIGKRGMRNIKSFISQVEKDAIEKTNKRWKEKLKKEHWVIELPLSDLLEDK